MARKKMFFDAGKAVRELGLPQTPVEEALERAVRWFGDHGYARKGRRQTSNAGAHAVGDRQGETPTVIP
jgi:hypothetical protein